jgi:DNA-binding response OmpR family regulator
MIRQTLEREGYAVEEASNGDIGMKRMQQHPADLVVTDIFMPDKEGIGIILELRQKFPQTKVIAISGGGRTRGPDYLPIAKRLGAQQTLAKPFERKGLVEAVNAVLGQ